MRFVRRYRIVGLVGVVALLATGLIAFRALRPGELLDQAHTAYPATAPTPVAVVYGTLLGSPLLVDGRLRVYASTREVRADLPVNGKWTSSPFWAYRRWPAQLSGIVAVGTTVVTQWSDGELVALDATRGTVAWRAHAAKPAHGGYAGRMTGALTAHQPPDLYLAGETVVVTGSTTISGYDAATGWRRWRQTASCPNGFTGPGVFVCGGTSTDVFDTGDGARRGWTGPADPVPVGCTIGHSDCHAVRAGGHAFLLGKGAALTPAPPLDDPASWLAGDTVVRVGADGTVEGVSATGGQTLWTWSDPRLLPIGPDVTSAVSGGTARPRSVRVIAVQPGEVHLFTEDRWVVTLDPADGTLLSWYPLAPEASGPFDLGEVYAAGGYLFIERARPGARATDKDTAYFYPPPNVIVAGT